jgi:UDP-N-acetylglucosamine 2-epimerase (non-hydrolysing)
VADSSPLIFPVHPRTKSRLAEFGAEPHPNIRLTDPLGYLDMLALTKNARAVFTDSGGLQEETTALGVPCLTLRGQTERPITVEVGTNEVVGTEPATILPAARRLLSGAWKKGHIPDLWDGRAAERIADIITRA